MTAESFNERNLGLGVPVIAAVRARPPTRWNFHPARALSHRDALKKAHLKSRLVRHETGSPEETEAVGAELARRLSPGDVVLVAGELGSGKTTFVRGAARALEVTDQVTSPTFTIGQVYGGGRVEVAHVDLYRLQSLSGEDPVVGRAARPPIATSSSDTPHCDASDDSASTWSKCSGVSHDW